MAEDHRAVEAARILLTLHTRNLTNWILPPPSSSKELAERPSMDRDAELPPLPEWWPKRPRDQMPVRESGWSPSLDGLFARLWHPAPARSGAGASSSDDERAWSPPRVRKRENASTRRSAPGSGPSTSGAERARLRVSLKVGDARKEAFVQASSPETPFDYAIAARSGPSSSSGDEGAPPKRKARRSPNGDEGCSSPAKRSRPDVHGTLGHSAAVKVEMPKIEENNRDEKGHLLFDLNENISMTW